MTAEAIIRECGQYIVFTGGEPLIQIDQDLAQACYGRYVGIETNGTIEMPDYCKAWSISLSPKVPRGVCKVKEATSLKIVYPYSATPPEEWITFPALYKSIQVIDPLEEGNIIPAMEKVLELGMPWRLGIQIHKFIGVE
jgi:organic radical activating enzyme